MNDNWVKTLSVNQIPDEEAAEFDIGSNKKIAIFNVNNDSSTNCWKIHTPTRFHWNRE